MTDSFTEIDRRAFRHDVVDGLSEIAMALFFFGGGLLYAAGRSGLRRYYVLLGLSLTLGVTLTVYQIPGRYLSLQIYLVGMGAITFVVGLITFVHFIRTHPVRDLGETGHAD